MNNMDYAYKAIMSILDDSLKQSIHLLLPSDLDTDQVSEMSVGILKLHQTFGENVKTFTSKFMQMCLDLGKNVPSDAPFTLNKQLTTS